MIFLLFFCFSICLGKSDHHLIACNAKDIDSTTKEITISFVVPEKDFIYKDFITCSIHDPSVILSDWKANIPSTSYYDPGFNDTKHIFNEDFSISMTATKKDRCNDPVYIYCSYYRKMDNKLNDTFFTFSFAPPAVETNIQVYDADIAVAPQENSTAQQHMHIFSQHYFTISVIMHDIIAFFAIHHAKCFYLFIILTALFLLLFSLYQERLQKRKKFYEIVEMIISLCAIACIACSLVYLYAINKPMSRLIATSLSVIFSAIIGVFYIKKSTKVSLGSLRTLYTCLGMLCIITVLLLMFKTIQHVDVQIKLF